VCEYPRCSKEIDRGFPYACGGEPFSELGCDRYFCSKHLYLNCFKCDGTSDHCDHEISKKGKVTCECHCVFVCKRCGAGKEPYPYKPETKEWVKHLLTDESWKEWRKKNPQEVKKLKSSNPCKDLSDR
jgi:hypothetical protein